MQGKKRIIGAALGGVASLALLLGGATPAQAAAPPVGTVPTASGLGFVQTKKAVDAGGVVHYISVSWNYKYDYLGVRRVSVNPLVVYRTDEAVLTTGNPEDAGLDLNFKVYSSNTLIQSKSYDGLDVDAGIANQVSVNPANPRSNADDPEDPSDAFSSVRVSVG